MKVKCRRCGGSKKYLGMGSMVKDCDVCDKTGWIEKEVLEIVPELDIYETVDEQDVALATEVVEHVEPVVYGESRLHHQDIPVPINLSGKWDPDSKEVDTPKRKGRPKKA